MQVCDRVSRKNTLRPITELEEIPTFIANRTPMSVKYKTGDDAIAHFITYATVDWVDVFTRNLYRDIIIESPFLAQVFRRITCDFMDPGL